MITALILASTLSQTPLNQRYLVSFKEPALLERADPTGATTKSLPPQSAVAALTQTQDRILDQALPNRAKSGAGAIIHRYTLTNNGVAMTLTSAQAEALRQGAGVQSVVLDYELQLQTDAGPRFVGADTVWNNTGLRGEGVVIGIIDSGINALHPSFAELTTDGFRHSNPRGVRFGLCNSTASARCNNKLIGIYDFTDEGARDGSDIDGHGSHVAGIAAGNISSNTISAPTTNVSVALSGVAPRANIISYKACKKNSTAGAPSTCAYADLIAAIEQAARDQVRVVNYSIGGDALDPWGALGSTTNDIRAMFNARAAGVVFTVSAGNSGPALNTVKSPANAPWVLAVANATHDRLFATELTGLTGSQPPPQLSFTGAGITAGLADRPIVMAERYGFPLCGRGEENLPAAGVSNPFTPGTLNGQIVVCERGQQARVAKGFNVRAAGGVGMILLNTELEGESIVSDDHFIPTVHLGLSDATKLKAWLRAANNTRGGINGVQTLRQAALGDLLNASSSRGPVGYNVLKPDLSAPGTGIVSADLNQGFQTLSGTSMAAPHVAGAAALVRQAHPNWSVDQVESALRTTVLGSVVRARIGGPILSAHDAGGGRLQAHNAVNAPLYFPLTNADLSASTRANASAINLPSLVQTNCVERCEFLRTVRANEALGAGSWQAQVLGPTGLVSQVSPAQFSLTSSGTQVLRVNFEVTAASLLGQTVNATLQLTSPGKSTVSLPIVLGVSASVIGQTTPDFITLNTTGERGMTRVPLQGFAALPQLYPKVGRWTVLQSANEALGADTTPENFTDTGGVLFRRVFGVRESGFLFARADIPANRSVLYLGIDANNDGRPSAGEIVCVDRSASFSKRCSIETASAISNYWVMAQVLSAAGNVSVQMDYALIPTTAPDADRNAWAQGPGKSARAADFLVDIGYDLAEFSSADSLINTLELYTEKQAVSRVSRSLMLTRKSAGNELPVLLQGGAEKLLQLAPGEVRQRLGFDLPARVQGLVVKIESDGILRAELIPGLADEGQLDVARLAPVKSQTITGTQDMLLDTTEVRPGRWYLRLTNLNGIPLNVRLRLVVAESNQRAQPVLSPEIYYNPARAGHGLFVTKAGTSWQVMWYTYDDEGQPAWFWMFPDLEATSGTVTAPILRYTFDGQSVTGVGNPVGVASFTRVEDDTFYFGYSVMGRFGSEIMRRLDKSRCAAGIDPTGAWYQPATSGWGASTHSTPGIEFQGFFIYDDAGNPRWVLGSVDQPSNGNSVTLYQHQGFCPTCAWVRDTRRPVGSYQFQARAGTEPMLGSVNLNVSFLAPLTGMFNRSGDFARLTGAKPCQP